MISRGVCRGCEKPKPCPICGRTPRTWEYTVAGKVSCWTEDHCITCQERTLDEAISKWNRGDYGYMSPWLLALEENKMAHRVCRDCTRREVGCHVHCPDYIAEKIRKDAEKAVREKEKMAAADFREFRRNGVLKSLKKKGRK